MATHMLLHYPGVGGERKENNLVWEVRAADLESPLTFLAMGFQLYARTWNGFQGFHFPGMTQVELQGSFRQIAF